MNGDASRRSAIAKALASSSPLEEVRELVPDDGAGAQQVLVYGYAFILETSSGGLSIVFDRFDDDELARLGHALDAIHAPRAVAAFRSLEAVFRDALRSGADRFEAADTAAARASESGIDDESESFADEVEAALVEYCKAHLDDLAREA
ncbi:MAG: hypothetical protein HC882_08325 [Acidobacteria bacterium]|nr:hypothetical protein [Acidobacteriota bacterium]